MSGCQRGGVGIRCPGYRRNASPRRPAPQPFLLLEHSRSYSPALKRWLALANERDLFRDRVSAVATALAFPKRLQPRSDYQRQEVAPRLQALPSAATTES